MLLDLEELAGLGDDRAESSLTAAHAAATAPVLEVTLTVRDDS